MIDMIYYGSKVNCYHLLKKKLLQVLLTNVQTKYKALVHCSAEFPACARLRYKQK